MFDVCVNAVNLSIYVIDAGNEIVWAATPLIHGYTPIPRFFDGVIPIRYLTSSDLIGQTIVPILGDSGFIVISDWSESRVASNVLCAVAATVSD